MYSESGPGSGADRGVEDPDFRDVCKEATFGQWHILTSKKVFNYITPRCSMFAPSISLAGKIEVARKMLSRVVKGRGVG